MAILVYTPKSSITNITKNFFGRSQTGDLSQFVNDNFIVGVDPNNGSNSNILNAQNTTKTAITDSFSKILTDYGEGPVGTGLNNLVIVNNNIINGTSDISDTFGHTLISNAASFQSLSANDKNNMIIANLQMGQLLSFVSTTSSQPFVDLVRVIAVKLSSGTYDPANFKSRVCRMARNLAAEGLEKI